MDVYELGLYGFVPREQLRGDFRRSSRSLKLRRGEQGYKTGDFIYLRLAQIDFARATRSLCPPGAESGSNVFRPVKSFRPEPPFQLSSSAELSTTATDPAL